MPDFHEAATARVAARPDAVFDLITDIERLPEWNACIERIVSKPTTLTTDAEWVVKIHVPGVPRWDSRSHLLELDRDGGRFVYRSQTDDGNASFITWTWELRPAGDGTEVKVSWHAHPQTFWRRVLFSRIRHRQLGKEVPTSLRAIAAAFAPLKQSQ